MREVESATCCRSAPQPLGSAAVGATLAGTGKALAIVAITIAAGGGAALALRGEDAPTARAPTHAIASETRGVRDVVHELPADLRKRLLVSPKVLKLWQALTTLGRNEFVCRVESAKQAETRARRIDRTLEELVEGRRRPCCWAGCVHRADKPVSPWAQRVLVDKQPKK